MTRIALILLGLLIAASAHAGDMRRLTINGVERTYYLHQPPTAKAGAPLVIFLHGATANGRNDVHRYGWADWAERYGFVVAGPDAPTLVAGQPESEKNFRTWNHGSYRLQDNVATSDDVTFISRLIDTLTLALATDPRRVYVVGFSSGGSMAHRLGLELSGQIAAISASAGGLPPTLKRPRHGMPILISAGDRDPVTPVDHGSQYVVDSHKVTIDKWRMLDDCLAMQRVPSKPDLLIEAAGPCRDGSEVRYIRMLGVAHEWPRTPQIDLTQTSWEFLSRFSLPR